jgi:hypothetical protein
MLFLFFLGCFLFGFFLLRHYFSFRLLEIFLFIKRVNGYAYIFIVRILKILHKKFVIRRFTERFVSFIILVLWCKER